MLYLVVRARKNYRIDDWLIYMYYESQITYNMIIIFSFFNSMKQIIRKITDHCEKTWHPIVEPIATT